MSRSFLTADIDQLVARLRTEEKISLLGAPNWWNTTAIERLEIPAIRMSDGPNGVRGSSHLASTPAQCIPCATSLAATFDPDLVVKVGKFLAEEAKIKSSVILLAPTCNIQRTPLGGRAFESFSEDPFLSGSITAAYVNGLQSEGVAATIKHFVGNDQEDERTAADSIMSDRALREIYLYPFMMAQKYAQPKAFMTSYGRLGGVHCSESVPLLQNILRDEWKFDGIVISDWNGVYGTDESIKAGCDLEMPGPPRWRTQELIKHCLTSQKLFPWHLSERAAAMLKFIQTQAIRNPEVVYGDGEERSRDSQENRDFCRRLAADGIVLLKNERDLLPMGAATIKRIAVIGPNAKGNVISGGGSALLKPTYVVRPFQGLETTAPEGIRLEYEVGCYAHKYLPTLENYFVTPSGEPGWKGTFHNYLEDGSLSPVIADFTLTDTRVKLNDFVPKGLGKEWAIRMVGKLTVDTTGPFEFGMAVAGRAKLYLDGELVIDNWTRQRPGDFFYGQGTVEEKAIIELVSGKSVDVLVEYTNISAPVEDGPEKPNGQPALMRGVRLGGCPKIDPEQAIQAAVNLASTVDAVICIGGLTPEWESEGFDRPTLQLPGLQDELITRVAKVNKNTVVVIQAGSAVGMPWVNDVAGILHSWYSGNEAGNAIADVVYGRVNPSGKLPLTFPVRIEDVSAHLNTKSENGKIHYREDLFVGYKHHHARLIKPLFPFGFGLSYTTYSLESTAVRERDNAEEGFALEVLVGVKNTGPVVGSQVVQVYISLPDTGITHPIRQLRGFVKIHDIQPGETKEGKIHLGKLAVAYWDTSRKGGQWSVEAGMYGLHYGFDADDILKSETFVVKRGLGWIGL